MTGYDYPILGVVWTLLVLLGMVGGLVLFVIAVIRWEMNSWKYVLLGVGFVLPFVGIVAGWIALFAGGVKRRTPTPSTQPPP